ncbi:GFA family protein [Pseudoalteromonas pernae]|uniref:GFA family protein n=1 Tax=Pseudoalteromonas pernae TaxID=3118054 RepID=UPI0032429551
MSNRHSGSCLCGHIKYELTGDFQSFYLCHCTRCQKGTGSLHGANLFAQNSALKWSQGEDHVSTYTHANSLHRRSFCLNCGSPLPIWMKEFNCVVIPAGSLDSPVPIEPTAKIFVSSSPTWANNLCAIPCFNELPE